jgi:glycine/D-amino acid oxidase-like deaminating enzyme
MSDTFGHNRPDPAPGITAQLAIDHVAFETAITDYEYAIACLPPFVESKEDHDRFVDLIAKMRGTAKSIEAARVAEKEPYLKSERAVDGFFFPLAKALDTKSGFLAERVKAYLDRKAAEERARRLAEQRKREEEEAALRRAEDARRRKAEEAKREETKARHAAVADALAAQAEQAAAARVEAEDAVAEKPAEMARTRAESGTLSTLKQVWQFEVIDWDEVDLDLLRPYIKRDAIEAAIRAAVKMGLRSIDGVNIFEGTGLTVR